MPAFYGMVVNNAPLGLSWILIMNVQIEITLEIEDTVD